MPPTNGQTVSDRPASEPEVRLAINLHDLDRLVPEVRQRMLGGRLEVSSHFKMTFDRRTPELGVPFSCDLLTAAMICDIIRSQDRKAGDWPTRLYIKRTKEWLRIPSAVVLTVKMPNGKFRLNPQMFKVRMPIVAPVPLTPKRVVFGKPSNKDAQ